MNAKQLSDLVGQSLDGWQIQRWHRVYRRVQPQHYRDPCTKLIGIYRYAVTVERLKQTRKNIVVKPIFVLVNGQLTFELANGKPIKQTPPWQQADQEAHEQEMTRRRALTKLTPAEIAALGLK